MWLAKLTRRSRPLDAGEVLGRLRRRLPSMLAHVEAGASFTDLAMDSLDVVELLCAVEDEFGVQLRDEELSTGCVGDIAERIAAHYAAKEQS